MATRKRTSSSGGFSSETKPVEEKVLEITEPSTPEELEKEIEAVEKFIEAAVDEVLTEVEEEVPAAPVPAPPKKVTVQNPPPAEKVVPLRKRRNIPRFTGR